MRTKSGADAIAKRENTGQLKILYLLKKQARIEKRFRMVEVVGRSVRDNVGGEFRRSLKESLN